MLAVLGQQSREHVQSILWGGLFRLLLKASWVLVCKYPPQTHTKTRGEFISLLVRQLEGVLLALVLPRVSCWWLNLCILFCPVVFIYYGFHVGVCCCAFRGVCEYLYGAVIANS